MKQQQPSSSSAAATTAFPASFLVATNSHFMRPDNREPAGNHRTLWTGRNSYCISEQYSRVAMHPYFMSRQNSQMAVHPYSMSRQMSRYHRRERPNLEQRQFQEANLVSRNDAVTVAESSPENGQENWQNSICGCYKIWQTTFSTFFVPVWLSISWPGTWTILQCCGKFLLCCYWCASCSELSLFCLSSASSIFWCLPAWWFFQSFSAKECFSRPFSGNE